MTSDSHGEEHDLGNPLDRAVDRRGFLAIGAAAAAGAVLAGRAEGRTVTARAAATRAAGITRGGTLRIGVVGGGQAETLNPLADVYDTASILRGYQLFDWLVYTGPNLEAQMQLATMIEPSSDGSEWTIRLRPGVEWHDGKPLTADDLMYTLQWLVNPKTASANAPVGNLMNVKAIKKLDPLTIRVPMHIPIGDLVALININGFGVIQNGTKNFTHPIGTGPFKFESWTPGQHSVFVRNPHYWVSGEPYVDKLEVFSIPDPTARLNALISNQVDAMAAIDLPHAKVYMSQGTSSGMQILIGDGPNVTTFTMGTAHAPFNDARVRQAIRLIVDRPQMIEIAQEGFGSLANDLWGPGYQYYDGHLPQRQQDIEQAKSLLKQAGQSKLNLTLSSTNGNAFPGQLEAATLLAQQATSAGVIINVKDLPSASYYSSTFPNYAFAQVQWQPASLPYQYLLSTFQVPRTTRPSGRIHRRLN